MNNNENQPSVAANPVPPSPVRRSLRFPFRFLAIGLPAVLVVAVAVFFLTGRKNPFSVPEVTLTYWGLWEPEPVVRGVIARFEKEHPQIKIKYQMSSPRDYKARLQNALAEGKGPDIFRFHQSWLPLFFSQLAAVPPAVREELALDTSYFPVVSQALQRQGNYYALPLMVDTLALYYNQDLLAGAKLPRSWWGLQQEAGRLTTRDEGGRIITAGVALGTASNVDHWSDIIGLMLLQNDADPTHPKGQLVEDVLQYYVLFVNQDHLWDETLPASTLLFASGKLAFYFAPSWRYFEIKQINPDLRFGITTVPQLPKSREVDWEKVERGEVELTNVNWASFWVEGVAATSSHQQEAWQFLSYLASEEGLRSLYEAASEIRDFGEIYPRVSLAAELTGNPYLQPFVKQAKSARWSYLCSFTHDDSLNEGVIKYYQDAINSLLAGGDSSSVTETLFNGVQQTLQRYKVGE